MLINGLIDSVTCAEEKLKSVNVLKAKESVGYIYLGEAVEIRELRDVDVLRK